MHGGATWQPAVVLHKHEQSRSFVICTPDRKQYRRKRKYLWKTDEYFPSITEPDICLNKDTGMRDDDTRDTIKQHTHLPEHTVVADQKETPDEHSETLI